MRTSRPDSAPDFLLSRGDGSVRTQRALRTFDDAWEAADAIDRGEAEMIVGALPFDQDCRAALTVPEHIIREPGPLEPHPYYRVGAVSYTHLTLPTNREV